MSEERRLVEWAGVVPRREICRRLRRSRRSVESKVHELRGRGVPVSLRCYRRSMEICPSCGRASALMGNDGICETCRRTEQLRRIEAETAELLAGLPEGERELYATTESLRETSAEPMPAMWPTHGMSRYESARNEERNDRAMEQWRVRRLRRLVKAAQKRKERVRRKAAPAGESTPSRGERPEGERGLE